MSRVPVLASPSERAAYGYLRPPAVVMRAEGEDEIQAIRRLRKDRVSVGASEAEWEQYEEELFQSNRVALSTVSFQGVERGARKVTVGGG